MKRFLWRYVGVLATVAVIIFLCALNAAAQTTNGLSEKEIQGRELAQKLLDQQPAESFTNTGVLQIRKVNGSTTNLPLKFEVVVTPTNWLSIYEVVLYETDNKAGEAVLTITHHDAGTNTYFWRELCGNLDFVRNVREHKISAMQVLESSGSDRGEDDVELCRPFAGSDFWRMDLGFEFLHWPAQKILRGEKMGGRFCEVLESTDPHRLPNGDWLPNSYSRMDSWIDNETLNIIEARAYDAKGKLLKVFYARDFKKVNGQWQAQSMDVHNLKTGSRTQLGLDSMK